MGLHDGLYCGPPGRRRPGQAPTPHRAQRGRSDLGQQGDLPAVRVEAERRTAHYWRGGLVLQGVEVVEEYVSLDLMHFLLIAQLINSQY